jgi:hypothetical protein
LIKWYWLERVVRSNVLFAVLLAAVVSLLIAAGWWSLSRCLNVRFRPIADISANSDAAVMRLWRLAVIAGLLVHGAAASAAPADFRPVPTTRQLRGLTSEEATTLLGKLEDAQRRLKAGEPQYFELLAGSIASYDMIKSSPRDVFLQVPFNQVWNIERVRTDNRLWQPYRLAYSPNGLGRIYWEIEVALGFNGDIQRVLMTYKPPAPF